MYSHAKVDMRCGVYKLPISKESGFTLTGILLFLVIVTAILAIFMRTHVRTDEQRSLDKISVQMQQVLNAGLSYYIMSGVGTWPVDSSTELTLTGSNALQPNYLPNELNNPWGSPYTIAVSSDGGLFYAYTQIAAGSETFSIANAIASILPYGYTSTNTGIPPNPNSPCTVASTSCYAVGAVNIPGYNLNNATALNQAGIYHHGGCVPVPVCPRDVNGVELIPQIIVMPVSVSGADNPDNRTITPIHSFTAYSTTNQLGGVPVLDNTPLSCQVGVLSSTAQACYSEKDGSGQLTGKYWRVCLQVITAAGDASSVNDNVNTDPAGPNQAFGYNVAVAAMVRCAMPDENIGSSMSVFTR